MRTSWKGDMLVYDLIIINSGNAPYPTISLVKQMSELYKNWPKSKLDKGIVMHTYIIYNEQVYYFNSEKACQSMNRKTAVDYVIPLRQERLGGIGQSKVVH
jgi:hypothetical protein